MFHSLGALRVFYIASRIYRKCVACVCPRKKKIHFATKLVNTLSGWCVGRDSNGVKLKASVSFPYLILYLLSPAGDKTWAINHKSSHSESLFSRLYLSLIQEHTMHRLGYVSSRLLDGQYQVLHTHSAVALVSHKSNERPRKLTPREMLIKRQLTLYKRTKTLIKLITPVIRAFSPALCKYRHTFGLNTNTNREP